MSTLRRVVAYDASPAPGGAATSLAALATPLAAKGIDLVVLARHPEAFRDAKAIRDVIALPADDYGAIHGAAYMTREIRRTAHVSKRLGQLAPDVVLMNNAPTANAAGVLAARRRALPFVQYVRAPILPTPLTYALLSAASSVLTVGQEADATVRANGRTPIAVGEGLSEAQLPTNTTGSSRGLFWCASLARWKGLSLTLTAFELAQRQLAMPRLDVCFESFPTSHPEGDLRPTVVPDNVRLFANSPKLDAIRSRAHLFIHSSLTPEPFGRSILEAAAAGLCPIVPEHSTAHGLVAPMVSGLTYRPGDARDLSRVLAFAVQHEQLVRSLGREARRRALKLDASGAYAPVLDALERAANSKTTPLPTSMSIPGAELW